MDNFTSQVLNQWQMLKPQREAVKEKLSRKFSLEFNFNSNHIEGNTLTYGQTEVLLLFGKVIGEAKMFDLEEMKAHNIGLQMTLEEASSGSPLSETFIRQLHKVLLREDYEVHRTLPGGVPSTYTIHAGRYKTRPNSVITTTGERFDYASPEETPILMAELIEWYSEENKRGDFNPLELAALFHYRYIRIHPFEDGNGRIARLLMNFILAQHEYPLIVIPTKTKQEYLKALSDTDMRVGIMPHDGAVATLDQIKPFAKYLERLMLWEMKTDVAVAMSDGMQWWFNGSWVTFDNPVIVEIINSMEKDPKATIRGVASNIGINTSAVQKHIKNLKERGYIIREGSSKSGRWRVLLTRL